MVKKILLSFTVIGFFIFYALSQNKSSSADNHVINTPQPTSENTTPTIIVGDNPTGTTKSQIYKDGEYIGDITDAFYGNIQVKTTIKNGKITDVLFLTYPNDRPTSVQISNQTIPQLKTEAIAAQSAKVDIISGATQTSEAFIKSLQSALDKSQS